MAEIILERQFETAVSDEDFVRIAMDALGCMPLYRVEWRESLLAEDGSRLVCRFVAPDSEAVRMVTRSQPTLSRIAWQGTVHDSGCELPATAVVERRFQEPADLEALHAREVAGAWCLETHRVSHLRTLFCADRRRMICLYHAPDAESVRLAQHQAGMPVERVWACRAFDPASFPG